LLDAPDPTTRDGVRDRAMLHLAVCAGLRVSELTGLRIADIGAQAASVRALGKGRRERALPLWKPAASALRAWMAVRGDLSTPEVFVNARGDPLSRWGVAYILRRHVVLTDRLRAWVRAPLHIQLWSTNRQPVYRASHGKKKIVAAAAATATRTAAAVGTPARSKPYKKIDAIRTGIKSTTRKTGNHRSSSWSPDMRPIKGDAPKTRNKPSATQLPSQHPILKRQNFRAERASISRGP
jgi:integrase/recombinase XerD